MHPSVNCPKCGRLLPPDGEMTIGDAVIPVYSCPECVTRTIFMGEEMELPLMFILDANGRPIDPANPDGEIDLTKYD